MTARVPRRAFEIWKESLGIDSDERDLFIQSRCGADGPLLEAVRSLMSTEGDAGTEVLDRREDRAPSQPRLGRGARVGPFEIVRALGQGGMGVVYEVRQSSTGRPAALKMVRVPDVGMIRNIRREIAALSQLSHPGIVSVIASGVHERVPWYAMELLEGLTLRRYLSDPVAGRSDATLQRWWTEETQRLDPIPPVQRTESAKTGPSDATLADSDSQKRVLTVMRRLCEPLAYLHGEGLVHRDLKPGNVMVTPDGWPSLVDFGLASRFWGEVSRESLELTEASGTLGYMSPEQSLGQLVDARSDLYSLGCILYEVLTGRTPFVADHPMALLHLQRTSRPEPPSSLRREVPEELDALVLRLLDEEPARRPGYAEDVAAVLCRLGAEPGTRGPSPRVHLYRPAFTGRADVVTSFERRLQAAKEGEGGLVLIEGESGVGKTRLVMEVARRGHLLGLAVATGECVPSGGALHGFRRLLQTLADRCRQEGPRSTERFLGERGPVLADFEPALSNLPGQEDLSVPVPLSAEAGRIRVLSYLVETLAALARDRPLLLVLDDLQWADEMTIGALEMIGRMPTGTGEPLLVIGTLRSGEGGGHLAALRESASIEELKRMSEADVAAVMRSMLALQDDAPAFTEFISRQSEGNPFFVAEYLRLAMEVGVLERSATTGWRLGGGDDYRRLPLPDSLREVLQRRLEGLPESARSVLSEAAVLGREFPFELLEEVASGPDREAGLLTLLARGILEERGARLRFGHGKLQEAAEARIVPEDRAGLCYRAAGAIEAYLASGGDEGDAGFRVRMGGLWRDAGETERAKEWFLQAAVWCRERYAWEQAAEQYLGALGLEGAGAESAATRLELVREVLTRLGSSTEEEAQLSRALDDLSESAAGDGVETAQVGELRLKVRLEKARVLETLGRPEEAAAEVKEVLEEIWQRGFVDLAPMALRNLGLLAARKGDPDADLIFEASMALFVRGRLEDGALSVAGDLGNLAGTHGDSDRAESFYRHAMDRHRLRGNRTDEAAMMANLAGELLFNREGDGAEDLFERALAIHRETGDRPREAILLSNLAILYTVRGDRERAAQTMEDARRLFRAQGNVRREADVLINLGIHRQEEGDLESSCAHLTRARAVQQSIGYLQGEIVAARSLAETLRLRGELEEARPLLAWCLEQAADKGFPQQESLVLGGLADIHSDLGELEPALDLSRRMLALNQDPFGARIKIANIQRWLGDDAGAEASASIDPPTARRRLELACARGHLRLARGEPADDLVREARRECDSLGYGARSSHGVLVARLERAVEAARSGEGTVRGECLAALPSGLARRLAYRGDPSE